jgi:hypothetical protein
MKPSRLLAWALPSLTLAGTGALTAGTAARAGAETLTAAPAQGRSNQHDPRPEARKPSHVSHRSTADDRDDSPALVSSRNINRRIILKRSPADLVGPQGPAGPRGRPGASVVYSPLKWGIIGRNTSGGSPNAVPRVGPWGRGNPNEASARMPPPYGIGSLGIIVGSSTEKIAFGNETDFAGIPLSRIKTLKYWMFTGTDSLKGINLPIISIEVNPHLGAATHTSLNYKPDDSVSPSAPAVRAANVWQQYDAGAAGSKWYATGGVGGCTQSAPCSFTALKTSLPHAVISFSLGFSTGKDSPFVGALDGLQVNDTVYDFEPLGVFRTTPKR